MKANKIAYFDTEFANLKVMSDHDKHVVDNIDTPIGQDILKLLLTKTGVQLAVILGKSTQVEFIDYRCEQFMEVLGDSYQSERFLKGPIGHTGVMEMARSAAFEGLQ